MQNNKLLFLFMMCCFGLYTQVSKAQVSESDSLELVNFYYATGGDDWNINSYWFLGPVSIWWGITVTDDGTAVKEIDLSSQNLVGEIPSLNLPSLEVLNLSSNQLTGEVPNLNLPNLEVLNLPYNQLTGNIPNLYLPKLEALNFSGNQLSGNIPNLNLPNLEVLNFPHNQLTGNIPNLNLPNLEYLDFQDNQLSSGIPDFSNLTNIKEINLEANQLTESIPNFDLPNLDKLNLGVNQLTGNIPNFNLPALDTLALHLNNLTGSIPNFSNLISLIALYCSDNILTGNIPDFNLPNLRILGAGNNQLTGISNFSNTPLLQRLYLYNNQLTEIPNFSNIPLQALHLSDNQLIEIPNFNNLPILSYLNINNNLLTSLNLNLLPNLQVLTITNNHLTEIINLDLPDLEDLYLQNNELATILNFNLPSLSDFNISNNLLETVPDFSVPNLMMLDLSNNRLVTIPDFTSFVYLIIVNLQNNELVEFPTFTNSFHISMLDISNNHLSEIPNFSNTHINILDISNNQLVGNIAEFQSLGITSIDRLYLSDNQLTGELTSFNNSFFLRALDISNNQITGNIPNFTSFEELYYLNVSNNEIIGTIPNFNLPDLIEVHLNNNELTGEIPNFNNLPNLEILKVCDNHLYGNIPNFENCPNLNIEPIDFSCVQSGEIHGTIFHDENENCIFDNGETQMPQGKIIVNSNEYLIFSDTNGEFTLNLDTGIYNISYLPPNHLWQQTCLNPFETYTITINSYDDVFENVNFANKALVDCALMDVNINTPLQRRCFTNNYTVQYCNEGTEAAEDAYVEIYFEEEIIVLDTSIPYTIDDEIYTFELGDVGIGQCGSFTVTDSISCEAVLGSAVCAMAYIYPDNHCREISDEWDGSDIKVSAACLGDVVRFSITNNGESMADSSSYRMYEDDVLSAILNFKIDADAVLDIDYPASGVTYRLIAEQRPGHPSKASSQAVIELCGTLPFSLGFVTSQSMANTESFFATHCEEIIGSYDPNDKLVTPKGIGDEHFIEANTDLEYKIRFQNTGNDTAFRVIVVDTLDVAHLDMSTFEALNSSHDYSLEIVEGQILRFTFDNILLVDSNANESASHGFVSFKINQMLDNEVGTVIENQAYIFFDYNQPILTPLAFSTIWEEPEPLFNVSISDFLGEKSKVKAYPNPANEYFFLDFSEIKQDVETAEIEIYDVFGRLVLAQKINANLNKVAISSLENGVYIYKIIGEKDVLGSGKIAIK